MEESLQASGYEVPDMNGWFSYNDPTAGQWADKNLTIPRYEVVTNPKPSDIVAIAHDYSDATGHVGIVVDNNHTASQSSITDKITINDWGFREKQKPTFRRCICK